MPRVATHVFFSIVITLAAIAGIFLVVMRFSPETGDFWQFFVLYLSVFVAGYGSSHIIGLIVRRILSGSPLRHEHARGANRQAMLFGVMIVSLLILSSSKLLNIWSAGLLLAILVLLELYIQ